MRIKVKSEWIAGTLYTDNESDKRYDVKQFNTTISNGWIALELWKYYKKDVPSLAYMGFYHKKHGWWEVTASIDNWNHKVYVTVRDKSKDGFELMKTDTLPPGLKQSIWSTIIKKTPSKHMDFMINGKVVVI